jgi:hypothetical protein
MDFPKERQGQGCLVKLVGLEYIQYYELKVVLGVNKSVSKTNESLSNAIVSQFVLITKYDTKWH